MTTTKERVIWIAALAVVVGIAAYFFFAGVPDKGRPAEVRWVTYTNEEFGFSIDYPENWQVLEFPDDDIAPRIHIVKAGETKTPPFTHYSDVTQVSIFPEGVPTEGVFGETIESGVSFGEETEMASDYVLEDGTPWVTFATFVRPPSSWQPWGFVWASVEVEDAEASCFRNGAELPADACDPFVGDTIVRRGTVNREDRALQVRMLGSLRFLDETAGDETGGNGEDKSSLIRVFNPLPNQVIRSPFTVTGEARGTWYFEATFPVVLVNWDGLIIAETFATAQGEWMTEEFVPFTSELSFESPYGLGDPDFMQRGTLILQKSNPSGLPEHDDAIEIPIRFDPYN